MQVYGEDANEGRAGECVALNVPEIDHEAVRRGMVLSESKALAPVTMAEADLRILDAVKGKVEDYLEVQLHAGTAATTARLAMLENTVMTGGQRQMVQLRLAEPLALAPGENFVIRANIADSGLPGLTTIGGGQILGISNVRLRRKKPWTIELLTARREAIANPRHWCERMLLECALPATAAELQMKCQMRAEEMAAALGSLRTAGIAVTTSGGAWLHRDLIRKTAIDMVAAIQSFHSANPQRAGIAREELLASLKANGEVLDLAITSLMQAKQLERNGTFLAQAGWNARLDDRDQRLCDKIATKLQEARWAPPDAKELAEAMGEPLTRVSAMMRLLTERGLLVRLDDRISMHRDAVEAGKQTALGLFASAPMFSTMDFRDALGVSRKYAVPLVDYLDKIRFTVRSANNRTPGVEAKKLLPKP
jgi:selenocysteine-specific elongation factor